MSQGDPIPPYQVQQLIASALEGSWAFDYPHVTSLLSDNTIQIHSIETQAIVQTVPASNASADVPKVLVSCVNGFFVPSLQRKEKLRPVAVKLRRTVHDTEAAAMAEKAEMEKREEAEEIAEDIPAL
ncbi:hypothetical protein EIP86_001493 [Pleurotus ostreatoroseus]|nr:hypothetical protein EIP86_001493 [Pleurotus ostreatoroseus]